MPYGASLLYSRGKTMAFIAVNNSTFSIGTTPITLSEQKLNNYSERIRLIITNTSTASQVISIAVDGNPVANSGIVLNAGGSIAWSKDNGNLPIQQLRVNAIASAVSGSVAIYEEVLNRG